MNTSERKNESSDQKSLQKLSGQSEIKNENSSNIISTDWTAKQEMLNDKNLFFEGQYNQLDNLINKVLTALKH